MPGPTDWNPGPPTRSHSGALGSRLAGAAATSSGGAALDASAEALPSCARQPRAQTSHAITRTSSALRMSDCPYDLRTPGAMDRLLTHGPSFLVERVPAAIS